MGWLELGKVQRGQDEGHIWWLQSLCAVRNWQINSTASSMVMVTTSSQLVTSSTSMVQRAQAQELAPAAARAHWRDSIPDADRADGGGAVSAPTRAHVSMRKLWGPVVWRQVSHRNLRNGWLQIVNLPVADSEQQGMQNWPEGKVEGLGWKLAPAQNITITFLQNASSLGQVLDDLRQHVLVLVKAAQDQVQLLLARRTATSLSSTVSL
jgi:hypothetical protein